MTTRKTLLATIAILSLGAVPPVSAGAVSSNLTFEVSNFTATANNQDGTLDTQAGDHPYSASASFGLAGGDIKDAITELPSGFIGNPQATPQCPVGRLTDQNNQCPADTQVGIATITLFPDSTAQYPVYNLAPEAGYPAEFGFALYGDSTPVILYASVRTGGDYGVTVSSSGTVEGGGVTHVTVQFWGVPADPSHDGQRWDQVTGFGATSGAPRLPFLTNPTNCAAGPITTVLLADDWEHPGRLNADGSPDRSDPNWVRSESTSPAVTGCGRLDFAPSFSLTPDTTQADAPAGDRPIEFTVPLTEVPSELATPELRNVVLTAPPGVSVNPGAADGLQGCTDAQFDAASSRLSACPDASQVGSVEVVTPLLHDPLHGQVFLRTPDCGGTSQPACSSTDASDGNLFQLFLHIQGPGVVVKQLVHAALDPSTGQITATAVDAPQLPFSSLRLYFNGGARADFINPPSCGTALSTTSLTPWSAPGVTPLGIQVPGTPDATPSSLFNVDWDGAGGSCPSGLAFSPSFLAQSEVPLAGAFTPFTVSFSRADRQQQLSQLSLTAPRGLLGMLSSVPLCPEPQATQGTCPAASRIGSTTVASGTGPHPLYLNGSVYLTGPYRGAPFGLSVTVPAVAGPFDLGNVVVRAAISVDPHTAQISVTSDPLPQILDGVPTHIQTVYVDVDRPGFMFNPTSCAQQALPATFYSTQGAVAAASAPFAVTGCAGLAFKPSFTVSTQAKTSKANGASLTVKVASAPGQANIGKVDLQLPKQLPSRLSTLQKACTEAQFNNNPAGCPRASIIGTAKAITPALNAPLTGPALLVSHGGAAFPDVEFVLQGQGVTIVLDGQTDIKKGVTYSRFETVPDAPITSFETVLPQGPYSVLAANTKTGPTGSFCGTSLLIPTTITGQNGAVEKQNTKITVKGCPKAKTKPKHAKRRGDQAIATLTAAREQPSSTGGQSK